jgi:hypothetical protein
MAIKQDENFGKLPPIRDLNDERQVPGYDHTRPASDYAPKRPIAQTPVPPPRGYAKPPTEVDVEAIEDVLKTHVQQLTGTDPIKAIKDNLKRLTHRQMREMCAAIFKARKDSFHPAPEMNAKAASDVSTTISQHELPDVLDKFAYDD